MAALFDAREPAAERIEQQNDDSPEQINHRKIESPSRRRSEWKPVDAGRLKHPMRRAIACEADQYGEEMDERKVQQVIKHGHLADWQRWAQESRSRTVHGREE